MGTTANRLYPYPDPNSPGSADMAGALETLAESVDLDVQALITSSSVPVSLSVFSGTSTASLTGGVEVPMGYTTVNYSNGAGEIGLGANRINVLVAGTYFLHFLVRAPDTATILEAFIRVNGADFGRVLHEGNPPAETLLVVSALAPNLSVGDVITTTAIQNTGVLVTIFSNPRLTMYKVA